MERIDDLQINNLKIIQNPDWFCFGVDSILLANYVKSAPNDKIIDLGTGNGIISILLAGKMKCEDVTGVEIQPEVADLARRSVRLNNLEDNIKIIDGDLRDESILPSASYDIVVSNTPYKKAKSGLLTEKDEHLLISRHEVMCTLEDIINQARRLLRSRGRLYLVHRPERLADIITIMRKHKLEPIPDLYCHPFFEVFAEIVFVSVYFSLYIFVIESEPYIIVVV